VSAECVAAMEDVLEVSAETNDPRYPKVHFDETNKPLIKETRLPCQRIRDRPNALITGTNAMAHGSSFSVSNRRLAGGTCL